MRIACAAATAVLFFLLTTSCVHTTVLGASCSSASTDGTSTPMRPEISVTSPDGMKTYRSATY